MHYALYQLYNDLQMHLNNEKYYGSGLQWPKRDDRDHIIGFYFLWDIWADADPRWKSWWKIQEVTKHIEHFYTVIVVERHLILMDDFESAENLNLGQIHHLQCMKLLKIRNSIYGFDDDYYRTSFSVSCIKKKDGKPCKVSATFNHIV